MKNIILLMLCCFVFVSPLYAAKDTGDKKAAAAAAAEQKKAEVWFRKLLNCEKKAVAALKKVKKVQQCKRAAKDLARIKKSMPDYGKLDSTRYRRMRDSLTASQKKLVRKNAKVLVELNETLQEEQERIEEIHENAYDECDEQTDEVCRSVSDDAICVSNTVVALLSVCEVWEEEGDFAEPRLKGDTDDEEEEEEEDVERVPVPTVDEEEEEEDADDFTTGGSRREKKNNRWKKVKTDD